MADKKLIVIGGGAAGFFSAVNAARLNPELQVIILEKTSRLLSKVKVSGGGRCNVTHACFDIGEMSRQYPRGGNFLKKAFHRFFTIDTIQWFKERGVMLKTEMDKRMFPVTDSSQTIIDCLLREADVNGVQIETMCNVTNLKYEGEQFHLNLFYNRYPVSEDRELTADFVCVACGGYPKLAMFDWLKKLGHTIVEPVPSLFTFNIPKHPITELMGISVVYTRVKIRGSKLEQEGPLLITHWGMSGPVILKLSAWGAKELKERNWEFGIIVNWVAGFTEQDLKDHFQKLRFERASQKLINKNPFGLPLRLWKFLLSCANIEEGIRWSDLPAGKQNRLINNLCASEFNINGKTTFKEEFVTAGGISLGEVDHKTMMSKKIPHLYFAGEILDIDGITGGFNFQNAWTTGFIAGEAIAGAVSK